MALWESPPSPPYDAQPFPDVPPDHSAASGVGTISALGVTEGTSATTFSPDDAVTREQLAVFMNRLLEYVHGVRNVAASAAPTDSSGPARPIVGAAAGTAAPKARNMCGRAVVTELRGAGTPAR